MTTQAPEQVTNQYGIQLVSADEVPAAPQRKERNTDLYKAVRVILEANEGQWALAKTWDNPNSAGQIAAQIRAGNNKIFPASEGWTARSDKQVDESDKSKGTSRLFVGYKVVDAPEATAEDAEVVVDDEDDDNE